MSGGHAGPVGRLFFLTAAMRLSHLTPSSSFSYLRSLLEHLGKARGLGDVEGHDQSAGCRSRALSGDPWKKREGRAQLPGNVACGRLTPPLSSAGPALSPGGLVCEASREGAVSAARDELTILGSWSIDGVARSGWAFCLPGDARVGCLADVARSRKSFPSLRLIGSVLGTFECCQFCP